MYVFHKMPENPFLFCLLFTCLWKAFLAVAPVWRTGRDPPVEDEGSAGTLTQFRLLFFWVYGDPGDMGR